MALLDLRDKKLLSEIEMNARIPHSLLARKIGVSKQVVKYRIERLEKEQIIQSYNAIIDVNKLSKTIYLLYLKLVNISSKEELDWIKQINTHQNVLLTAKNAGNWDLTIVLLCLNNQELDQTFKEIAQNHLSNIKNKLITSEIESTYFTKKIFSPQSKNFDFTTSQLQEKNILDQNDEKILSELAKNCRISLIDLAQKIQMSPNGVKEKIKKLENKKIIIGYKTKINYEKLGYLHHRVFLHLNNFNKTLYNQIKEFLKNKGNTDSVSRYIGYADIDFRCYTKNIQEFYQLMAEIKDRFAQQISEIDSMTIFNWEKIQYYAK